MGVKKKKEKSSMQKSSVGSAGKRNSIGMPKFLLVFIIVIVLVTGVTGAVVSPSKSDCRETIQIFQSACNELDANKVVRCIKPSLVMNFINLGTLVAGDEAISIIKDILGNGVEMMGLGTDQTIETLFKSMEITPKEYGFPGKTRKVRCRAVFGVITQYVDIYLIKYHGDVYITKVKFIQ